NNSGTNKTANVDYIGVTVTYTVPGTLNWYTVSSGGSPIGSGTSFNPVGVVGSGLANTNTPGTYTFYAECSSVPGCSKAADFIINASPTVTVNSSTICEGETATVTASPGGAGTYTYVWTVPAGVPNPGNAASFTTIVA